MAQLNKNINVYSPASAIGSIRDTAPDVELRGKRLSVSSRPGRGHM